MTSDRGGIMCFCPKCGNDLRGDTIVVSYGGTSGEPRQRSSALCRFGCGRTEHYSRLIGIYDQRRDRTVSWQCPDCLAVWDRGSS
jgi:hypothetical protein